MIKAIIKYLNSRLIYTNGNIVDTYTIEVERPQQQNREEAAKEGFVSLAEKIDIYAN